MSAPSSVTCLTDPDVWVDRPTWSPDGKKILALASDPTLQAPLELALFTTSKASEPNALKWSYQGPVTAGMHGKRASDDVFYASWAPDNTQVAFTANWGSRFFSVFLAPVTAKGLGPPVPVKQIQACHVAWRPDSKELAIMRADPGCGNATGTVLRVNPEKPSEQVPLRNVDAGNPAWQPFDLSVSAP
jgi:hypothetical protein